MAEIKQASNERLNIKRENLIYLPYEDAGYPNIPMLFLNDFNPALFAQNHRLMMLVGEFCQVMGTKSYKAYKRGTFPIPSIKTGQALQIVEALQSAPKSEATFAAMTGQNSPRKLMLHEEVRVEIWEGLRQMRGKGCLFSPSHITDFHLLDILRSAGVRLNEVGLVVVDQHIDGNVKLGPDNRFRLDKSNFLIPALNAGLGAVSFFGLNENDILQIKGEMNLIGERGGAKDVQLPEYIAQFTSGVTDLQEFYKRYPGRISFAQGVFNDYRSMISPKKVLEAVKREVKFLKSRGIKQVLLSFDLDSLNMMRELITATEYNPFNSVVLLGVQDLTMVLRAAGLSPGYFEEQVRVFQKIKREIEAMEIYKKRKGGNLPAHEGSILEQRKKEFASVVQEIYPVIFNMEKALHAFTCPVDLPRGKGLLINILREGNIISSDEGGFSLKEAEGLLAMIKSQVAGAGMENGISVFDGRMMGSVSELDGKDVNGRSAAAAIRMINAVSA